MNGNERRNDCLKDGFSDAECEYVNNMTVLKKSRQCRKEGAKQMITAIISIKPEYVEKIFNREKYWELRKQYIKADHFIVYATAPLKMVVGHFFCDEVIKGTPNHLLFWLRGFGIKRRDFDAYFEGKDFGYAHRINRPELFPKPLPITHYGLKRPPQSFCYLKEGRGEME